MSAAYYDVYADLHVTHVEIGYLLAIGVVLLLLDTAGGLALLCWPPEEVYLVDGIADCRSVPVHWGAPPPRALARLLAGQAVQLPAPSAASLASTSAAITPALGTDPAPEATQAGAP